MAWMFIGSYGVLYGHVNMTAMNGGTFIGQLYCPLLAYNSEGNNGR